MNKEILQNLEILGLSEKEAAVYVSLLRQGEVGSSKIIKETELHGQYVYQALGSLEEKGLVQHAIRRGRKKFSAKSPQVLTRLIDQQKVIADSVAIKLQEMMILPPDQRFEVFQGRESYVAHEFELLEQQQDGSELLVIGGAGDKFNEMMGERLQEYALLQVKKNISIRYIGSEGQRAGMPEMHGHRKLFESRYLPGLFTGQVNTNVWLDCLGFNIFGEPVTRFTIWSPVVAGSYRQFFETLWKLAKP
ncbi:MAG: Transcriptional regulator TrmB [Parcubacteria group bacterium Gr01-1014_29]|nr:MAG: Transcriptional regulator TrmB [Parcubacteria group bacterium Gr01-1014_29]